MSSSSGSSTDDDDDEDDDEVALPVYRGRSFAVSGGDHSVGDVLQECIVCAEDDVQRLGAWFWLI